MKKPSTSKKSLTTAKARPDSLKGLLTEVRQLIQSARRGVASVVDTFQVMTNYEIGRRIVEHEQKGAKRAAYGTELLKELSAKLTEEFGRGFSEDNLSNMRRFFLMWKDRVAQFPNSLFGNLQQPVGRLAAAPISEQPIRKSPFTISWTHYQVLFTFDEDHYFVDLVFYNRLLRCYVIIDLKLDKATHQDLGQMQIYPVRYVMGHNVLLRLCSSQRCRRKLLRRLHQRSETSFRRARSGTRAFHAESPTSRTCVLRSLSKSGGRRKAGEVSQNRLGQALHQVSPRSLSHGLYPVRCSQWKASSYSMRLSHGVNVNYYDREVKLPDENPTIGLLLCKSAKKTVVELTLPKDANIHAKEYQLYLPSKELLKQKLDEWSRAKIGR